MSFLGSLRTWLLFNNKIIPQKYNLPNNSALPVSKTNLTTLHFHRLVLAAAWIKKAVLHTLNRE